MLQSLSHLPLTSTAPPHPQPFWIPKAPVNNPSTKLVLFVNLGRVTNCPNQLWMFLYELTKRYRCESYLYIHFVLLLWLCPKENSRTGYPQVIHTLKHLQLPPMSSPLAITVDVMFIAILLTSEDTFGMLAALESNSTATIFANLN